MKGNRRILLITAVLAVAPLLAGCTSAISDNSDSADELPDDMTADELQMKAANASDAVESATFTMEMSMSFGDDQSADMEADGAMNMAAEKMRMEMKMDTQGQTIEMTQYVIGNQIYMQTNGVWQQQTVQDFWDESQYVQQQEALESATEVEVVDQTTVNGDDAYVMDVNIDEDELLELIQQQGAQEGMEGVYDDAEISNIEMTQYLDTETYQIRQVEMNMDLSLMGEETTMDMTMTYDDINEPVDITLPEEAEDATESGTAY